jgi:tyrosyl-tRNA synthetase
LAKEIVTLYHGKDTAEKAEEEFNKVFREKQLPSEIEVFETDKKTYPILDLLCDTRLVPSKTEAKRLVEAGAVRVSIKSQVSKIKNWKDEINIENGIVIKIGNRRFVKIKVKGC